MTEVSLSESTSNQVDFVQKIKKQKKFLYVFTACFTGLVTTYFLTCPDIYQAKTLIVFPQRLPSMGGGGGGGMGSSMSSGMMEMLSGGGSAPLRLFIELLTSDRVLNYVADRSNLKKKELKDKLFAKDQRMSNTMILCVEDENIIKAQRISRLLVSQLRELNSEINIPSIENEYKNIVKELEIKTADLALVEQRIQRFIETCKTAPIGKEGSQGRWLEQQKAAESKLAEINASISSIKNQAYLQSKNTTLPTGNAYLQPWKNELTKLKYELKMKEITMGPESPEIIFTKDKIDIAEQQLKEETQKYILATNKGISSELSQLEYKRDSVLAMLNHVNEMVEAMPKEMIEYQRLTREATILNNIVLQLRQQAELLHMSSSRDPNKWNIVDDASISGPTNKGLAKPLIIGLIGSIFLGIPLVIWRERPRKKNHILIIKD